MKNRDILEPSFLFIIPTLDSFITLDKLINSFLSQSYRNWNAIFVDGPSSIRHKIFLKSVCANDSRFSSVEQPISSKGIFAAMNSGLEKKIDTDWILFWGSDDYFYDQKTLSIVSEKICEIYSMQKNIDLIICEGIYVDEKNYKEKRKSFFINRNQYLNNFQYKRSLFLGNSPPHQATIFNKNVFSEVYKYDESFKLSADLKLYLKLINKNNFLSYNFKELIVCMGDGGVSGKGFKRRISEVIRAYKSEFNKLWFIPFFLRYFKRILFLL